MGKNHWNIVKKNQFYKKVLVIDLHNYLDLGITINIGVNTLIVNYHQLSITDTL